MCVGGCGDLATALNLPWQEAAAQWWYTGGLLVLASGPWQTEWTAVPSFSGLPFGPNYS